MHPALGMLALLAPTIFTFAISNILLQVFVFSRQQFASAIVVGATNVAGIFMVTGAAKIFGIPALPLVELFTHLLQIAAFAFLIQHLRPSRTAKSCNV